MFEAVLVNLLMLSVVYGSLPFSIGLALWCYRAASEAFESLAEAERSGRTMSDR